MKQTPKQTPNLSEGNKPTKQTSEGSAAANKLERRDVVTACWCAPAAVHLQPLALPRRWYTLPTITGLK